MSERVVSWVLNCSPVEHRGDLLVLLALAHYARDDGAGAHPSVALVAEHARLSRRGAQLALRRLEAANAIQLLHLEHAGTPRVYHVVMEGTT